MKTTTLKTKDEFTPAEEQRRASTLLGYGAIHLARVGDHTMVMVQIGELWIPIIQEFYDERFDQTAYPLGIEQAVANFLVLIAYRDANITNFFSKREALFEFTSHRHWIAKAQRLFPDSGHTAADSICIDAEGRVVTSGNGFSRAEREGTYPIKVFSTRDALSELAEC